jgi:hypothetical protein
VIRFGADGVPYNGRTGRAGAPVAAKADDGAQVADRAAESARAVARALAPPRPHRGGALLSLLGLAATIIILGAGVALAGALMWPKTHAARAEVLFPITREQPTGFLREDRSMTTQLVLIRGRAVLGPIAEQQHRTVEDLREHVTAQVLETSEIIQLEVTDRSPDQALHTTQAVLDSYLKLSQAGQPELRQRLETEIAAANTAIADAQAKLSAQQGLVSTGRATAATLAPLQSAEQAQQSRLQQLQAQLDAVNLAPVGQLLTAPYPVGVVSPRPVFAATAGGLVGLLLAAVLVAVLARSRATKG